MRIIKDLQNWDMGSAISMRMITRIITPDQQYLPDEIEKTPGSTNPAISEKKNRSRNGYKSFVRIEV